MTTFIPVSRVELASAIELASFLVPCYGFDIRAQAEEYWRSPNFAAEVRGIGGEVFVPVHCPCRTYVPRMSPQFGNWLTTSLVAREAGRSSRGNKPIWELLRRTATPRPSGSYNTALLVEGRRQFFRCHRHTTQHPKWWYTISDGPKDCFATWGRVDNATINQAVLSGDSTHVYAARSGRGVIYACETKFDDFGKPAGSRSEIVRVEFSILDRDPAKDDMMRVWVFRQISFLSEPRVSDDLDSVWRDLIARARAGFNRYCKPVPDETEKWRQFFVGQRELETADRRNYSGTSFHNQVEKMDWQEALRIVKHPWQLAIVASCHGRRQEFSSDAFYSIPYETVPEMIRRHECNEQRRAELVKMIADYVAPGDNLWNYRGD